MKLKKHFSFSDKNQVWRILVSDSEKLVIETRDVERKQAYYHCIDLFTGRKIFFSMQLDEKYWIGIETIYKDIIFFHKFAKPDMPGHKEIIAFEIEPQKELWRNDYYSFLFIFEDKVYCGKQLFEGWKFYALDFKTGELIEEFGNQPDKINELRDAAGKSISYEQYHFPVRLDKNSDTENKTTKFILDKTKSLDIIGEVEYNECGSLLLFNYHEKSGGKITNRFHAIEFEKEKELLALILNDNANSYVPDSYFVYKNILIILKEKKEVLTYKME